MVDDRLLYEARVRPRYAVLAALAGLLLLVAAIMQLVGPHTNVSEITLDLITANKRGALDLLAAVINGLGSLALAGTLAFMFDAARARNPGFQPMTKLLPILGGIAAGVAGVAYSVVIGIKAHQFATTGSQTYQQAHQITTSGGVTGLQLVGQAAALLLAIGFVLISLQAMRVGLLTRFMGYLGLLAGVLVLFQITQLPVVQAYWLFALAYLLSGRWPTGVPPAWRSGKAEPWPSGQELRAQRAAAAGDGRSKEAPPPPREPVGAGTSRSTRSNTPKRKRKRRR